VFLVKYYFKKKKCFWSSSLLVRIHLNKTNKWKICSSNFDPKYCI